MPSKKIKSRLRKQQKQKQKQKKNIYRWWGTEEKNSWTVDVLSHHKHNEWIVQCPTGIFHVRPTEHGKGCFLAKDSPCIPPRSLIGVYPGHIINEVRLEKKYSQMQEYNRQRALSYVCQGLVWSTDLSKKYLDPSNDHGSLDKQFKYNPMLYCNEPTAGKKQTVYGVWNYDTKRLEIWSVGEITPGTELLVSYGHSYDRNYDVADNVRTGMTTRIFKDGELTYLTS